MNIVTRINDIIALARQEAIESGALTAAQQAAPGLLPATAPPTRGVKCAAPASPSQEQNAANRCEE